MHSSDHLERRDLSRWLDDIIADKEFAMQVAVWEDLVPLPPCAITTHGMLSSTSSGQHVRPRTAHRPNRRTPLVLDASNSLPFRLAWPVSY